MKLSGYSQAYNAFDRQAAPSSGQTRGSSFLDETWSAVLRDSVSKVKKTRKEEEEEAYLQALYKLLESGTRNNDAPASPTAERESAFSQYIDVELQKQKMRALPKGQMLGSVYMQFMEDYRAWKAEQPETQLPDSEGWTEENLSFLRQHYDGELSACQIYDVLDTMKSLGMIDQKTENYATGNEWIAIPLEGGLQGGITYGVDADSKAAWLSGFDETPIVGFHNLDDILSWVEKFQQEDHPDFITHAEARVRGWVI